MIAISTTLRALSARNVVIIYKNVQYVKRLIDNMDR